MIIAFIISVYQKDSPALFQRAINSILNQEMKNININIYLGIDGNIPPTLEQIITKNKSLLHRIIRNKKNLGLAKTLNKLIFSLDDENFVFRLDSDDYCSTTRVNDQLSYMLKNPDVGILGGAIQEVDHNQKLLNVRSYPHKNHVIKYLSHSSPLAHPSVVFRKSALVTLEQYPDSGCNEDILMWFKAISKGVVIDNIDNVVLYFQVNKDFYLRRGNKKAFEEAYIYLYHGYKLNGASPRLILPILRLLFRASPSSIKKYFYHKSPIRYKFLNK